MKKYKTAFCDLYGIIIKKKNIESNINNFYNIDIDYNALDRIKKLGVTTIFILVHQYGIDKKFINRFIFNLQMSYISNTISELIGINCSCEYTLKEKYTIKDDIIQLSPIDKDLLDFTLKTHISEKDPRAYKENICYIGNSIGFNGRKIKNHIDVAKQFGIDYIEYKNLLKTI